MTTNSKAFEPLYEALGYTFKKTDVLTCALTHASFNRGAAGRHYERLEFLGDRVLGLIVAAWLFERFPHEEEGALAKRHAVLVSRPTLLQVADALGLKRYFRAATSVTDSQRGRYLLADACEALIAALYLEAGLDVTQEIVRKLWAPYVTQMEDVPQNPKSRLQEWAQEHQQGLPVYTTIERQGPDHAPSFVLEVRVGQKVARASASSKREAEQQAATALLKEILG